MKLALWPQEMKDFDVQGAAYLVGCKSDLDTEVPTDESYNLLRLTRPVI